MMNKKKYASQAGQSSELRENPLPYRVWGERFIDEEARKQMDRTMQLPVSVAGALMPDAHVGYGLPIGGVLATDNAVIPYAVGVDIACRMRMTIYPVSPILLSQKSGQFKKALLEQTRFGAGVIYRSHEQVEHPILYDEDWDATPFLRSLKTTAYGQLGTSGTGNHFVEWGSFKLEQDDAVLALEKGTYLALLSHSGSRGVGFKIANLYSRLAKEMRPDLDPSVSNLAWFDMDSHYGQEYWLSMELAGRFASANHEVIHNRVTTAIGLKPEVVIENHHNFAWKETIPAPEGFATGERTVIVHRKGATPAGQGVHGIIPGSMGDEGYVVRGRGMVESINSASHGAGRAMSRKQATASITKTERDKYLRAKNITLLGGGMDEAPQAYKRIGDVIGAQHELVDILGSFMPLMVRMADDGKDEG
jgi:tRNA-splicing ligase RtcB (3'-phosphate/5'-hydroxy nucleic acid ligase)